MSVRPSSRALICSDRVNFIEIRMQDFLVAASLVTIASRTARNDSNDRTNFGFDTVGFNDTWPVNDGQHVHSIDPRMPYPYLRILFSQVAHLLSFATSACGIEKAAGGNSSEFVVLRRAFVFAEPHARSKDWEMTYGSNSDPVRRFQASLF